MSTVTIAAKELPEPRSAESSRELFAAMGAGCRADNRMPSRVAAVATINLPKGNWTAPLPTLGLTASISTPPALRLGPKKNRSCP